MLKKVHLDFDFTKVLHATHCGMENKYTMQILGFLL